MTVTVVIYRIDDTYDDGGWGGTTYQSGYYIHVLFDTVTKGVSVQIRTGSTEGGGSLIASPTSGPNLFFGYNGAATRVFPANLDDVYSACDGTTLDYINVLNNYPYGGYSFILNSPSCQIAPVCDLEFTSAITVVPSSGPSDADGGFTVLANSSNGTVKYSLTQNFDYATATNTTGVFSGLLPDDYTVYAKDPIGCQDSIRVKVTITEVYAVRFRHEFQDNTSNFNHKIDIEERAYEGSVEEVNAGPSPIRIDYKGDFNDPTKIIIPSVATINLMSESEGQFQELFLGDDFKYRVKYYIDEGSGYVLYWTGYVIPEFYSEPYTHIPFEITVNATDGLGELANTDFLDANENNYRGDLKQIKIVSEILKKSPLEISIRSFVDVFETTMNTTAADDPLDQAYVDARLFFTAKDGPQNCFDVLNKILLPYRARIFQSQGYWNILRVEKSAASSIPYRQFDPDGVYESNSTLSPSVPIGKPRDTNTTVWRDRSQLLSFLRNYGYFKVSHNLAKDANLIDEGDFELTDLIEDGNGDVFFKNWNFLIGQTNMSYGYENLLSDNTGAFVAKYQSSTDAQNDSVLYTYEIPFAITSGGFVAGDRIKIGFKVLAELYYTFPWVRIGWSLRITDNDTGDFYSFYPPNGDFVDYEINEEVVNDLYLEKYNEFQGFELGYFHLQTSLPDATLRFALHFHNHLGRDFDDYNDLRGVDTVELAGQDRRYYFADATGTKYYKLKRTLDAESVPDVIEPDDFDTVSNPQKWVMEEDIALGGQAAIVSKFLFDKVQISFYPFVMVDGNMRVIDPPANSVYDEEVSRFVKPSLTVETHLGDCPDFNNAPSLYKGYLKLSDGTPTDKWARAGITEELYLNQILLNDLKAQHSEPLRHFQGTLIGDRVYHFINYYQDYLDSRKYVPANFSFEAKEMSATVDLIEVITGADGNPPPQYGAFKATAFSSGFKIGG